MVHGVRSAYYGRTVTGGNETHRTRTVLRRMWGASGSSRFALAWTCVTECSPFRQGSATLPSQHLQNNCWTSWITFHSFHVALVPQRHPAYQCVAVATKQFRWDTLSLFCSAGKYFRILACRSIFSFLSVGFLFCFVDSSTSFQRFRDEFLLVLFRATSRPLDAPIDVR